MDWLGLKHPMLVHLPLAAALLLPLPLLLAQRAGRGIRPWWVACRYLAWTAFLALLLVLPSGFAWAKGLGVLTVRGWLAAGGSPQRRHEVLGLISFLLLLPTLWALHRKRKDHEGLGWMAFLTGTLFSVATLMAGAAGHRLSHSPVSMPASAPQAPAPVAKAAETQDPERDLPLRALDHAALHPVQPEPVRSQPHGNRFVRTWVNAAGAAAFEAGQPLPPGTFVALSSQEIRWGRPGPEEGPLWAYEIGAEGRPAFQFYWARVPEDRRGETEGKDRVYWRGKAPQLQACAACHGTGASDPAQRGRFRTRR
jgi:hypothetical protein